MSIPAAADAALLAEYTLHAFLDGPLDQKIELSDEEHQSKRMCTGIRQLCDASQSSAAVAEPLAEFVSEDRVYEIPALACICCGGLEHCIRDQEWLSQSPRCATLSTPEMTGTLLDELW